MVVRSPGAQREELPHFVSPMLLRPGTPPAGEGWAVEVKFDGMLAQLRYDGRRLCLCSRRGRDWTAEFPELAELADALGRRQVMLDAELVCLGDHGKPDFERLRGRLGLRRRRRWPPPATLMVFDLLHLDGRSTRALPYSKRRSLLEELRLDGPLCRTPECFVGQAEELLAATAQHGLEGVVAKRLSSSYEPGRRSGAKIKHKHRRREAFVVKGVVPGGER